MGNVPKKGKIEFCEKAFTEWKKRYPNDRYKSPGCNQISLNRILDGLKTE